MKKGTKKIRPSTKIDKITIAPTAIVNVSPEPFYQVSVIIMGKKYYSVGNTIYDAVFNLNVGNAKGKCIMVVEKNGFKKERVFMPNFTNRLFNSRGLIREIVAKQISTLFQGI